MNSSQTVLVYGGTGAQGLPIAQRLSEAGHQVRSLTRSAVGSPTTGNVQLTQGDLDDLQSLTAATHGCDAVVLLLPLGFDVERASTWTENAVSAAESAGVKRFVFDTSGPTPDTITGVAAVDIKVRAEGIVRASALQWVIVRPTLYLGNLTAPWSVPAIVGNQTVAYPLPAEVSVNWTSWEAVADVVAWAVENEAAPGQTVDVGGYEAATGGQLAKAFGAALGGTYAYSPIPLEAFEAGLNQSLGKPVGTEISKLYAWLAGEGSELLRSSELRIAPGSASARQISSWILQQDWPKLAAGA